MRVEKDIFGQVHFQYIYRKSLFLGNFSSLSDFLSSKQRSKQERRRPRIQGRVGPPSREKKGSPRVRAGSQPQT